MIQKNKLLFLALLITELPILFGFAFNGVTALGLLLLLLALILRAREEGLSTLKDQVESLLTHKNFNRLFILISIMWVVVIGCDYFTFEYKVMDDASFANPLFNLLQRGTYYNTYIGMHGFVDHFTPNLILFSPLFLALPTFLWLNIVKLIAFLVSPFLLQRIGKEVLGKHPLIWLAPMLWLLHQYMMNTLFFSFQPSSLSLPFVLWAILLAIRQRFIWMMVPLVFVLGFKEQMALVWVVMGFFLISIQGRYRLGGFLVFAGVAIGVAVNFLVIPYFNNWEPSPQLDSFGPLHFIPGKLEVLFLAFASLGFLPFLAPRAVFFVLPAFALTLISQKDTMMNFTYHYQDLPLTVAFVAMIYGLHAAVTKKTWLFSLSPSKQKIFWVTAIFSLFALNTELPQWKLNQIFGGSQVHYWLGLTENKPEPIPDWMAAHKDIGFLKKNYITPDMEVWAGNHVSPYFVSHWASERYMKADQLPLPGKMKRLIVFGSPRWTTSLTNEEHKKLLNLVQQRIEQVIYQPIEGLGYFDAVMVPAKI